MHDVEQLHDRRAVVRNRLRATLVNQLVHATWTERRLDRLDDRQTSVDIARQLTDALTRVGALFKQDDRWLLTDQSFIIDQQHAIKRNTKRKKIVSQTN